VLLYACKKDFYTDQHNTSSTLNKLQRPSGMHQSEAWIINQPVCEIGKYFWRGH